jgi:hypothetical protein
MLVEPVIKSDTSESIAIKEYVKTSIRFFYKNPGVCLVILSGMITGAALNFIDEFWQLYINRLGIPVIFFGVFSACLMFLRLPGNMFAYALKSRFRYRSLLLGVTALFAVGFFYISVVKDYTSLMVIFLICLCSGIIEPITTGYLHHRIDSNIRATLDSFQSLGSNLVLIIMSVGFGFFSARLDIFGGYGFIGFICGGFFVYFFLVSRS